MEKTKNHLEEVANAYLDIVQTDMSKSLEEDKTAFKHAMEACDRLIQIEKIENEEKARNEKLKKEQSDEKFNKTIRIVEVAAVPVALFVADCLFRVYMTRTVCNFEKDYTFTTSAGKGISGLLRFKK